MGAILDPSGQPLAPESIPLPEIGKGGFVTAPPGAKKWPIPETHPKIAQIFWDTICDEGTLLTLCLEYCTDKVERLHNDFMAGRDFFSDDAGPGAPTRMNFIATATPLALKLYQEILALMGTPQGEAIKAKIAEALQNAQNRA